jgi:hypothetical protein
MGQRVHVTSLDGLIIDELCVDFAIVFCCLLVY